MALDRSSSHFYRANTNLRFTDWRFVFKGRLNLLEVGENLTRFGIWKNCRRCHSEGVELETQVHAMSTRAGRCKTTYTSPVREQRLTLVSLTLVSACYPLQIRPVLPRPPSACAATPARRGSSSYATRCAFRSAAADLETLVAFSGGERPAAVRLSLSR